MRALVVEDDKRLAQNVLMVFGNAPDMPWTWPMMRVGACLWRRQ